MAFSTGKRPKWLVSLSRLIAVLLVVCCAYWGIKIYRQSQQHHGQFSHLSGEIFHTYYSIKYDRTANYQAAIDSVFSTFSHSLNPFDSTSLIAYINRHEAGPADSMLLRVWSASRRIAEASGGSYDVTCSPLINAWGFGFSDTDTISAKVLDSLRSFVGYNRVRATRDSLIKEDPRMKIDFSSISKGYCSDLVGEYLHAQGAEHYMVDLGGEMAFRGLNPQGKPWRIGVSKPIDDPTGLMQELELIISLDMPQGGLATSGNYRNYKMIEGKKYAHTINPLTGYPIQTDVLSATIIAPSCMMADGLATACMTKTSQEIPAFLAQFEGVEYMLILGGEGEGYRSVMSPGFSRLVVPKE